MIGLSERRRLKAEDKFAGRTHNAKAGGQLLTQFEQYVSRAKNV
jgi:hypothetical protein